MIFKLSKIYIVIHNDFFKTNLPNIAFYDKVKAINKFHEYMCDETTRSSYIGPPDTIDPFDYRCYPFRVEEIDIEY